MRFADANNISLTPYLPPHLFPACTTQLNYPVRNESEIPERAARFGVLCLPALFLWNFLGRASKGSAHVPWTGFRDGLVPARRWEKEIDALIATARSRGSKKKGSTSCTRAPRTSSTLPAAS